ETAQVGLDVLDVRLREQAQVVQHIPGLARRLLHVPLKALVVAARGADVADPWHPVPALAALGGEVDGERHHGSEAEAQPGVGQVAGAGGEDGGHGGGHQGSSLSVAVSPLGISTSWTGSIFSRSSVASSGAVCGSVGWL